jgi:hypothetical protein
LTEVYIIEVVRSDASFRYWWRYEADSILAFTKFVGP